MPYIEQDARVLIDNGLLPINVGELNYAITSGILNNNFDVEGWLAAINTYLNRLPKIDYAALNGVMGVFHCIAHEMERRKPELAVKTVNFMAKLSDLFYSRFVAPYEGMKMRENGDLPW